MFIFLSCSVFRLFLISTVLFPGWAVTRITFGCTNSEGGNRLSFMVDILEKLRLFLIYFLGLFVLVFEYLRRGLRSLKPVRVGSALTWAITGQAHFSHGYIYSSCFLTLCTIISSGFSTYPIWTKWPNCLFPFFCRDFFMFETPVM